MSESKFMSSIVLAAAGAAILSVPATQIAAQQVPMEGPVSTTALISAESKGGTPLTPTALSLEVNGHVTPLDAVTPVRPQGAQVAILIDDGLRSTFSLQLKDLASFIEQLPAGMQVLVGYMRNGEVVSTKGFTANHQAAADELRIPISSPGVSASPYFCLSSFVKHWPSNQPAARFALMLTNGVDPYNGSTSIMNQDSPYVQTAQEDAQRAGVAVYSIYFGESGMRGGRANFSGQDYLSQVAQATGGASFYNGLGNPVALAPFLDEFRRSIAESYTISFKASANREKRDTLARIKLKTTQQGVKIHAPDAVHPGVSEASE